MKILSISASAGLVGFESPAANYSDLDLSLDQLLIDNPTSTYLCRVNGHSMTDFGIHHESILVIDRSLTPKDGDIIAAIFRSEFVCKQLDLTNRLLRSGNPFNPPVPILEDDQFSIEGVCTRVIQLLKPATEVRF